MESSVANARAVHVGVAQLTEVVNGLSPADDLCARQRHILHALGHLARLHVLVPDAFVLALLHITMLLLGVTEARVEILVANNAGTGSRLQLSIHHNLIEDELGGSITARLLHETLLVLEVLNIAVLALDVSGVLEDVSSSLMLDLSLLRVDLLLPELNLLSLQKGNLFGIGLPGTSNSSHISRVSFLIIQIL